MDTPKVQVTVAWPWPGQETTEWLLAYPRVGENLIGPNADLWEVTCVTQVPEPKAEFIVTVDKPK
ncbi:hypothetical protein [Streptomyces platensis]|uniref:hypothetical protein n=1 Tax=Streptomyces platensis TaxID=58346 RepID=UPI002E261A6B